MTEYSLALALQNFMPVILSTAGLLLLAQMIAATYPAAGRLAQLAVLLIAIGGLLKALWKLTMALSASDVPLFSQSLFPLLAPGFTALTWALWLSQWVARPPQRALLVWGPPLLLSGLVCGAALATALLAAGRAWVFVLLSLVSVANIVMSLLLVAQAWRQGLHLASLLFGLNLIGTFALSAITAIPNKSVALHWTEQGVATLVGAAICYAAWQLDRAVRKRAGRRVALPQLG